MAGSESQRVLISTNARGGDIPTYRKEYSNDASGGDVASELTLEKKPKR